MKFTKLRFACLLDNAINLLESSGLDRQTIKEEIGITDGELEALEKGNVEEELAEEERFKIYLEICAENRLTDIEYRVQELWEGESSFLCGFTADEVIGNKRLMNLQNLLITTN